jgi:predicted glycoside hydrolase/deacetylase ChbG (UPF0249 family)
MAPSEQITIVGRLSPVSKSNGQLARHPSGGTALLSRPGGSGEPPYGRPSFLQIGGVRVAGERYLIVTADDYGIGPETSRGILDLALTRKVTAAVLLVNSPYAEQAVRAWRREGQPMELGWHPCLTLDKPLLPVNRVRTLVDADGRFWSLARFMRRLVRGRIFSVEIEAELRAQYHRFRELTGEFPSVVNTHHHVQVFPSVGPILYQLFDRYFPLPYMRRVRESWYTLATIPGARAKRLFLSTLGRRDARLQARAGFPGNDFLAGVTNPSCVADPHFLSRWVERTRGNVIELTCHPGHLDKTLIGRDCTPYDGQLERRPQELELLRSAIFDDACRRAGLVLTAPREWLRRRVAARVA